MCTLDFVNKQMYLLEYYSQHVSLEKIIMQLLNNVMLMETHQEFGKPWMGAPPQREPLYVHKAKHVTPPMEFDPYVVIV